MENSIKQPPWHEPSEKEGFYAGENFRYNKEPTQP
jgi:hypothetical protein